MRGAARSPGRGPRESAGGAEPDRRSVMIETRRLMKVPMPAFVNTSSSTACSTRPSMIWAVCTPPCTASIAHRTFGSIPPAMVPSATRASTALTSSDAISVAVPVEKTGRVCEQHELLRLERLRELARHQVGVDVVGHAPVADPDWRDDRDEIAAREVFQHCGVDARDLPDVADVDDLRGIKLRAASGHGELAGVDEPAVLPGEPHRVASVSG